MCSVKKPTKCTLAEKEAATAQMDYEKTTQKVKEDEAMLEKAEAAFKKSKNDPLLMYNLKIARSQLMTACRRKELATSQLFDAVTALYHLNEEKALKYMNTSNHGLSLQEGTEDKQNVKAFLSNLKSAECESDVIEVGPCKLNPWTMKKEENFKIYVRKCYKEIYDLMTEEREHVFHELYGVKGIGKSYFGIYVIWRILQESHPWLIVLWNTSFEKSPIYVHNTDEGINVTSNCDMQQYSSYHCYFVGDANYSTATHVIPFEAMSCNALKVIILSDGMHTLVSSLESTKYRKVILPSWTTEAYNMAEKASSNQYEKFPEEFRDLHQKCHITSCSNQQLLTLVPKLGLIPRSLFNSLHDDVLKSLVKQVKNCNIDSLMSCFSNNCTMQDIPSSIICYTSSASTKFRDAQDFSFVSPEIANEFLKVQLAGNIKKFNEFITMINDIPQTKNLQGQIYEQLIHHKLSNGEVFQRAKKCNKDHSTVQLSSRTVKFPQSLHILN